MKSRAFKACGYLVFQCLAAAAAALEPARTFAALHGEIVLENPRVLVEKFVLKPGETSGRHTHRGDQLLVFVKGGILQSVATGRATLWRDGRVAWEKETDQPDDGFRNAGSAAIVMIWVTVKPVPAEAASSPAPAADYHLNYPNIPGEDLLENERVVVQRFVVNPGQWEGVHAHRPNMLYIHLTGGQWAARSKKEPEHAYPKSSPDGEVGWMPTIALSEGHESGNIGRQPIDLIWVTLKD